MKKQVFNLSEIKGIFPLPLRERVRVRGKRVAFTLSEVDSSSPNKGRLRGVSIGNNCKSIPTPSLIREGSAKLAFTLAEVLITLGVIGVVAAMTMPILIQKRNEQVTITKLKKFYSVMSQAQQQAIAEYGDVENWDWVSDADNNNENIKIWFDKYFAPYLKTTEVIEHKIVNDNGDDIDKGFIVKFADGTIMNIKAFSGNYVHFIYYTNYKTFINGTAKDGKDAFWFGFFHNQPEFPDCHKFQTYICKYIQTNGSQSYDTNSETVLKNNSKYGCYKTGRYCARLIQMNGWKVPSDYPYKF